MPPRRNRRKIGGSLSGFWDKTKGFLKRTKLLSTIGSAIAPLAGAYAPWANRAVDYAKSKGYGRRRMIRRQGGGALRPVGASRRYLGGMMNPVGGKRMSNRMMGKRMPSRQPMIF
jgi:hypothetical protein